MVDLVEIDDGMILSHDQFDNSTFLLGFEKVDCTFPLMLPCSPESFFDNVQKSEWEKCRIALTSMFEQSKLTPMKNHTYNEILAIVL